MAIDRQWWFWLIAVALAIAVATMLSGVLLPFVAGAVIAYLLDPAAGWLERRGLRRTWAAALLVGTSTLLIILFLLLGVPRLVGEVQRLLVALPAEIERVRPIVETWLHDRLGTRFPQFTEVVRQTWSEFGNTWRTLSGSLLASLLGRGLAIVNFLSLLLVTPIVVFYLLIDWHPMLAKLESLVPREQVATVRRVLGDVAAAISAAVRGQGMVAGILALVYASGLWLIGLDHALSIGVLSGVLTLIPIVGAIVGTVIAVVVGLFQWGASVVDLVKILLVYGVAQALESMWLSPKIVGERIGLHPVWMIFALFAFSYLLGFAGTLIAVPLAAATSVLVRHAVEAWMASEAHAGDGPAGMAGQPVKSASDPRPSGSGE